MKGFKEAIDSFIGLEGGGGGGDFALNSCSVFGLAFNLAFSSAISLFKNTICSSFSVRRSIARLAMSCASTSAALIPSRKSSLDVNLV